MKPFLTWLAGTLAAFGLLAGGYHLWLDTHPHRVAVIVDSSHPMSAHWSAVARILRGLEERPYTEWSLFTEKGKVHGWARAIDLGKVSPYAPRDFSRLEQMASEAEIEAAAEVVLVTDADPGSLVPAGPWRVVRPAR